MAVRVRWADEEKTVLYADHQGDISTTAVIDYLKAAYELIEEVDHEVTVVADLTGHGRLTDGMIAHFYELSRSVHPRTRHTYMIGLKGLSHTITDIYARTFRRMTLVDSAEEAFRELGINSLLE